jgi:hypothetical protein
VLKVEDDQALRHINCAFTLLNFFHHVSKPKLIYTFFLNFSFYRKENTTRHHYKDKLVNVVQGK